MRKKQKADISSTFLFAERAAYGALSQHKTWFSFSVNLIRHSRFFLLGERLVRYIRRFRIVTAAFRLFPWLLLLINTHTLFYALAGIAVILLPLLLIGFLSFLASASIRYRKLNASMTHFLENRKIYVFFPTRVGELSAGRFWIGHIQDLAKRQGSAVFIVSPFLFSARGMLKGPFFTILREEAPHVFLIRRHYFFSLRKNVFPHFDTNLFFIY